MIRDDYPVFRELVKLRQQLQPIRLTFKHVDGHLDTKKPKRPLTVAETLNIECDTRAKQHSHTYPPIPHIPNPLLENSYPHLRIRHKVVHRLLQHSLRDAATKQEYFTYLSEKFQWEADQIDDIHWPSIDKATQRLTKPERRIISKFQHEWLPLETRYHVQSTSTLQQCPSCRQHAKTVDHFLRCHHPERQQLWEELVSQIQRLTIQCNLQTSVREHLIQGIRSVTSDTAPPPTNAPAAPTYCTRQQQLGWKQMLYGRYSQQWITVIHQHDPPINGQKLITKIIYLTWQQVLALWKIRNLHLHPPTPQNSDRTRLRETIQQILHDAQQHPHLADMVGHIDIEQLMTKPTKTIQQFITRSHDHIREFDKAAATRARLNTHDIRNYFQQQVPTPTATTTEKNYLGHLRVVRYPNQCGS